MTLTYDFSDAVEGGSFVTLPPGRYAFKLISVTPAESNAGNPKAVVQLEVVAGSGGDEYIGGIITQHWPTTGKASFRFRDFLMALKSSVKERGKLDMRKLYGKTIGGVVSIKLGEDEETEFNDLSRIVPGKTMLALLGDDDDDENDDDDLASDDDDGDDDGDDDDVPTDDDDDDDNDDDNDDEDDDDDEDDGKSSEEEDSSSFTVEDVADMDLATLKSICEEYEIKLTIPEGKTRLSAAILRKRVIAELFADEEEDNDEEPF